MLAKPGYERGLDYPHTSPDLFVDSSLVKIDSGEVITVETANRLKISDLKSSILLPGTDSALPALTISLRRLQHKDRIAILGIGSNCSPTVLMEKFKAKNIGGDFILAQTTCDNHAICHGAFLGGLGTVPATVHPHRGTTSNITVGFYTPEQAAALTSTEPNYDLVALKESIKIRGIQSTDIAVDNALLYVSVWGSLKDPMNSTSPLALSAIPQKTDLTVYNSKQAMNLVSKSLGQPNAKDFFNYLADDMPMETRLGYNSMLSREYAHAAQIAGKQIKRSTIARECEKYDILVPEVAYLQ